MDGTLIVADLNGPCDASSNPKMTQFSSVTTFRAATITSPRQIAKPQKPISNRPAIDPTRLWRDSFAGNRDRQAVKIRRAGANISAGTRVF
jgi:hypothetical protein